MARPPVLVRAATAADAAAFLDLIDALADYEHLARPDAAARQRLVHDALGPAEQRRVEVFLAEVEGRPVGYAVILETYSTFLALPTLYLEDIFVLESARGSGAGHALFKRCAAEALQRGCGRMEWMVLDWNQLGQRFYDRLGAKRLSEWLPYRMTKAQLEALVC